MPHWATQSVFYHIYPLGCCGAPPQNDFQSAPQGRLERLYGWMDYWEHLGANALYVGPLFEASTHGYDTADYFTVDRRLGTNETLSQWIQALHQRRMRVILDAVFNHVGRDFWAFKDVQRRGPDSPFCGWFQDLTFGRSNPCGDPFTYATWRGYHHLVKLNVRHPGVKSHLFEAAASWIREFNIDGLRLDTADCIDMGFLRELAAWCRRIRSDFWLLGEVIHGNYCQWVHPGGLDSVTNYEAYKGLFSSHNDRNYFEIAYSLDRQFGPRGLYSNLHLYAFTDNHDVNRLASVLKNPRHLYPAYCLLFTMPGVPSIYYGSEFGLQGRKLPHSDSPLRPEVDLPTLFRNSPQPHLQAVIQKLAWIRRRSPALMNGDYRKLWVRPEELAFQRRSPGEIITVMVNASEKPATMRLSLPELSGSYLEDLLNPGKQFRVENGVFTTEVDPCWARILRSSRPA
jgi:cyclomaltodextrinase